MANNQNSQSAVKKPSVWDPAPLAEARSNVEQGLPTSPETMKAVLDRLDKVEKIMKVTSHELAKHEGLI